MDVREKLAFSVCNATQKTNYKCDYKCEKKGKCAYCLVMADQMIVHGVTVQEWISVKDRLPEQGQEVIVYSGGVLKPTVFAYQFWNKNYDSWARITHWMPLPEPPKGE